MPRPSPCTGLPSCRRNSQYKGSLTAVLQSYLLFNPEPTGGRRRLAHLMRSHQLTLLNRCGWVVNVQLPALQAALAQLEGWDGFAPLCHTLESIAVGTRT
jgi:hypothetical protein